MLDRFDGRSRGSGGLGAGTGAARTSEATSARAALLMQTTPSEEIGNVSWTDTQPSAPPPVW